MECPGQNYLRGYYCMQGDNKHTVEAVCVQECHDLYISETQFLRPWSEITIEIIDHSYIVLITIKLLIMVYHIYLLQNH